MSKMLSVWFFALENLLRSFETRAANGLNSQIAFVRESNFILSH